VVHPGTHPDTGIYGENLLNAKLTPAALKQEAIERFKRSLLEAARFAESHDVIIGLENSGPGRGSIQSTIEDLAELVADVDSPALQIALDLAHANDEGKMQRAIKLFHARIRHIRVYDSKGKDMQYGEIGTGSIQWKLVAGFLKDFPEMLTIKVLDREDIEGAVLRSKQFLDNLLKA
jgi:sugar phosphate isomerase/epimerase